MRCQLVLEAFDDIIGTLEKMIKLRAGKAPASARPKTSSAASAVASLLSDQFRVEYEASYTPRAQVLAIRRHFAIQRVDSEADIAAPSTVLSAREGPHLFDLHCRQ